MPQKRDNNKAMAASTRRSEAVQVIEAILERVGQELKSSKGKVTIGDFVRLLQLRNELDSEQVKEVKVQWVEEP